MAGWPSEDAGVGESAGQARVRLAQLPLKLVSGRAGSGLRGRDAGLRLEDAHRETPAQVEESMFDTRLTVPKSCKLPSVVSPEIEMVSPTGFEPVACGLGTRIGSFP